MKRRHMFLPELTRWLTNPVFPAAVMVSAALILVDIFMGLSQHQFTFKDLLGADSGFTAFSPIVSTSRSEFIKYATLCLCSLPAVGIYAEDFEGNAVYMRVQRLGGIRYALGRVLYTAVSSWLCAFLAEIVCVMVFRIGFGLPFLEEGDDFGWMGHISVSLQQGKAWSYLFFLAGICGLRACFYSLLAMAFTIFVPNRRAAFALPLLFWYFNEYMLWYVEWIPSWIQPASLYQENPVLPEFLSNEWQFFLYLTGYTLLVAVFVFLLLLHTLRKNGTFGGELE